MGMEKPSSFRRIGRSNSTLLASELAVSEVARVGAYSRLSQSMRVFDEPICEYDYKRRKNRALTFLLKVFSCKNTGGAASIEGETVKKAAAEQKKTQCRRRWPVQGWGKEGMENEGKVAEQKKRRQPTVLPNPYRRWPVQGW